MFGHPVQDHLPAHRRSFTQEWQRASEFGIDIHCESSDRRTGLRVTLVDFRLGIEVVVVGSGACTGSLLGAAMEGGGISF